MRLLYITPNRLDCEEAQSLHSRSVYRVLSRKPGVECFIASFSRGMDESKGVRIPEIQCRIFGTFMNILLQGITILTFIRREKIDRVLFRIEAYVPGVLFGILSSGVPFDVEVNGTLYEELRFNRASRVAGLILRMMETMAYRFCQEVFPVTEAIGEYLVQTYGVRKEKIRVRTNGVDPDRFLSGEYHSDAVKLGYCGSLSEWQGIETVLAGLSRWDGEKIELAIAGTGPAEKTLRSIADEFSNRVSVRFYGRLAWDQTPEFLSNMAIVLVPKKPVSGGWFPLKLIEAFAAARPVLAAEVRGMGEFVRGNGSGWLYEPDNEESFRRALQSAIEQKDFWRTIGNRNRELAESRFSWESIWSDYPLSHSTCRE